MIYCDTSLLVAALTLETHSVRARAWLDAHADQDLAISDWVITEFASALAMKARRGTIDVVQRRTIELRWRALVADALTVAPVKTDHFRAASALVDAGRHGLRAGDALHLAVSLDHGFTLATFDDDLADAARSSGILADIDRS